MQPEATPKQQQFLQYLEKEINRAGKAPSLRQAAAAMMVHPPEKTTTHRRGCVEMFTTDRRLI